MRRTLPNVQEAILPPSTAGTLAGLWPGRSKIQEALPGLLISNWFGARNIEQLRSHKITHVVVCADELPEAFPQYFSYFKLKGLTDNTGTPLGPYFEMALPWIKQSIDGGGRVLLHCALGSSRSGALLTAYLMWDQHLTAKEALAVARKARLLVDPNPGFLDQLNHFEGTKQSILA